MRFVCRRAKAELRPFIVVTILGLDLCTVDVCALKLFGARIAQKRRQSEIRIGGYSYMSFVIAEKSAEVAATSASFSRGVNGCVGASNQKLDSTATG